MKEVFVALILVFLGIFTGFSITYGRFVPCYTATQVWDEQDKVLDQIIEKVEGGGGFKSISTQDDIDLLLNRGADLAQEIRIHANQCLGINATK